MPGAYIVVAAVAVFDAHRCERLVHQHLQSYARGNETFEISIETAKRVVFEVLGERVFAGFDLEMTEVEAKAAAERQAAQQAQINARQQLKAKVDEAIASAAVP